MVEGIQLIKRTIVATT